MVLRSKELWDIVEKTVLDHGLELFDIEIPSAEAGVVRVYICRPAGDKTGVKVEDCARISRTLLDDERFDEVFPAACILEVSSPGINRKLTKPQHFHGAIGERVKLTVTMPVRDAQTREGAVKKPGKATVRGVLQAFDGNELKVEDESLKETVSIPWPNVHEARVDFLFK
jgi:ribosome maturation factor RimP